MLIGLADLHLDCRYEGEWRGGKEHGLGTLAFGDGGVYTGEFREGERSGHGRMVLPDGREYEGEWLDGLQHGPGTLRYPDGRTVSGNWAEGMIEPTREASPENELDFSEAGAGAEAEHVLDFSVEGQDQLLDFSGP